LNPPLGKRVTIEGQQVGPDHAIARFDVLELHL
jgi:ribosome-interacting GTPase 1